MKLPVWLNKNIVSFGFVSLFADFGSEMATAILPAFIVSLGGTAAMLGIIEGVANASVSFTKLLSGWYSDHAGIRKPFTIIGYACNLIGIFCISIATRPLHILIGRVTARLGKGIREPARDAMLAESVTPAYYGRIFGFHRAMDTCGAIIGPATALLLIQYLVPRSIFLIALIPSVIALLIVIFGTREVKIDATRAPFFSSIKTLPDSFKSFLIAVGIFGVGNFAVTLLILRVTQLLTPAYGTGYATSITIFFYTLFNLIYALSAPIMGYYADKKGALKLLKLGYICMGFASIGLATNTSNLHIIGLIFLLTGIATASVVTLEKSIAASYLEPKTHSTGYGVLAATKGMGDLSANIITGILWSFISPVVGFAFSAICCFIGARLLGKHQADQKKSL